MYKPKDTQWQQLLLMSSSPPFHSFAQKNFALPSHSEVENERMKPWPLLVSSLSATHAGLLKMRTPRSSFLCSIPPGNGPQQMPRAIGIDPMSCECHVTPGRGTMMRGAQSRDTSAALNWLRWPVASNTVHRKAKWSMAKKKHTRVLCRQGLEI